MKPKTDTAVLVMNSIILVLAAAIIVGGITETGIFIYLLILQFFTGIIQYPMSLFFAFTKREPVHLIQLHAVLSTFYLAVLFIVTARWDAVSNTVAGVIFFVACPWLLAILFSYITFLRFKLAHNGPQ